MLLLAQPKPQPKTQCRAHSLTTPPAAQSPRSQPLTPTVAPCCWRQPSWPRAWYSRRRRGGRRKRLTSTHARWARLGWRCWLVLLLPLLLLHLLLPLLPLLLLLLLLLMLLLLPLLLLS